MKILVLCRLLVKKFNTLLECLLPYLHVIIHQECTDSGIQVTDKANELKSVMTVCRRNLHFSVSAHMQWFVLSPK